MPPQIALLAVSAFVLGILILDSRRPPHVSFALWIPTLWAAELASRPLSTWFDATAATLGANAEEGSPMDRVILSLLLVAAVFILLRRKLPWTEWLKSNPWIVLFFLYCGMSLAWSDFPGIGLRRWIRALGGVTMVLVVLSERDPLAALGTLVRRCAYVLVPFSVLLIKYFRERGVVYDYWTGEQIVVGVGTDKNALGRLCLIAGLFAVWELVTAGHNSHLHRDKLNRATGFVVLLITLWLLVISDSKTALVSILIGSVILIGLGLPFMRTRTKYLGTLMLVCVLIVTTLSAALGLAEHAAAQLGRNLTLTDRTFIWAGLLGVRTNPVLGVGYDTFWLGRRLDTFVNRFHVTAAHNGYLEIYLELGIVGLCLFAGVLLSVFRKAKRSLTESFDYGRLRIVMLTTFMTYNVTESGYKATTAICWMFLLVAIDFPAKLGALVEKARPVSAVSGWSPRVALSSGSSTRAAGPNTWRPPNKPSTERPSNTQPDSAQRISGK